jgi:hypothetical protein
MEWSREMTPTSGNLITGYGNGRMRDCHSRRTRSRGVRCGWAGIRPFNLVGDSTDSLHVGALVLGVGVARLSSVFAAGANLCLRSHEHPKRIPGGCELHPERQSAAPFRTGTLKTQRKPQTTIPVSYSSSVNSSPGEMRICDPATLGVRSSGSRRAPGEQAHACPATGCRIQMFGTPSAT